MEIKEITEANRKAWNEVMPRHQAVKYDQWNKSFSISGFSCLSSNETKLFKKLGLENKSVAHVCCNNGVELLSLKNMGAGECVGFDISDEAIKEAKERADRSNIDCNYVRTDIFDIQEVYFEKFDIVYISIGCLGWIPNLKRFFQIINKLLKRKGIVFIHERHPFAEMLPYGDDNEHDPLQIIEPYFKKEPYVSYTSLDYLGNTQYESSAQYWFVWTISDILMNLINNELNLKKFLEYNKDISTSYKRAENSDIDIPLSYIAIAEKL